MEFNGAVRVHEFSQGDVIRTLVPMLLSEGFGKSSQHEVDIISNGFCYALSLEWLRLANGDLTAGPTVLPPGEELCRKAENLLRGSAEEKKQAYGYFAQIAKNFVSYFVVCNATSVYEAFLSPDLELPSRGEIDMEFLKLGSNSQLTATRYVDGTNTGRLVQELADVTKRCVFFGFSVLDENGDRLGGHRVAFCRFIDELYFFDPNFGIYRITDLERFIGEWKVPYNATNFYFASM